MNTPNYQDIAYQNNMKHLAKMEALREGLDATKKYLRQWEREDDDGFKARKDMATLYNATKKAVNTANGMIFRKALTLQDINSKFLQKISDIDNADSSLDQFTANSALQSVWDGLSFIIVDMPKNESGTEIVSMQQQLDMGIVPYFTKVLSKQVINKRIVNNMLTQITIEERIIEPDGEFGEKEVTQYRVLRIGEGLIYNDNNEITYSWTNNLKYIPIIPVYSNRTGYLQATPKFLDVADLNIKHFNYQSQLDKTLFVASNPVPVIYGHRDDKAITIGVDKAIVFADKDNSGFEWVEFAGTSVEKLQDEIKNIELRMASLALSMLTNQNKERTATEAAIESTSETSDLSSMAVSFEDAINVAYQIWCEMMGQTATGEIIINKDFIGRMLSAQEAKGYLDLFNSGAITIDQLWDELQQRQYLNDFDRDLAKAKIEAQNQNVGL